MEARLPMQRPRELSQDHSRPQRGSMLTTGLVLDSTAKRQQCTSGSPAAGSAAGPAGRRTRGSLKLGFKNCERLPASWVSHPRSHPARRNFWIYKGER